ncbi:type II toxin-antitoxin system VapC family toxin [Candidatus Palauibacter sp.]|uniref:type II toxin-antitoxin system VapC family toxin n=1 Tax=Candidatus Palauibacter sp. TaxID=3101350 RepID=UPI003B011371
MILIDTGPLVAAFDPSEPGHAACGRTLAALRDESVTTAPVLTEAFHLLARRPRAARGVMDLVLDGPLAVSRLEDGDLWRCFDLMVRYADMPMDFAEASLVCVGERSGIDRVFTRDRRHFSAYRMRRGHRHVPFTIIEPEGPEPTTVREPVQPYGTRPAEPTAESALGDVREALDRLDRILMR